MDLITTVKNLTILNKNGTETTLEFSDSGALEKKTVIGDTDSEYKSTYYIGRDKVKRASLIQEALSKENIADAVAITGTFVENGEEVLKEGILGTMYFSAK